MTEMQRLARDEAWEYALAVQAPRLTVKPGEKFVLETNDAFNGAITKSHHHFSPGHLGETWYDRRINPVAGPVFVEGAEPGDVIAARIHDIVPADWGFTATEEGEGPLAFTLKYPEAAAAYTHIVSHKPGPSGTTSDGTAVLDNGLTWRLAPMVGCIGLAPLRTDQGNDTCTMQNRWGGNLDVTDYRKGSILYFPVAHEGGLLYAGDVHASQATEFHGTPIETPADITLSCEVIKKKALPFVRVETEDAIIQVASKRPWEEAVSNGYLWLMDWLVEDYGMDPRDVVMHFNGNPDVKVRVYCTSIGGKTQGSVGVSFPKSSLPSL